MLREIFWGSRFACPVRRLYKPRRRRVAGRRPAVQASRAPTIMTDIENAQREEVEKFRRTVDKLSIFPCPVLQRERGSYSLLGTGVIVVYSRRYYLATAAHVAVECEARETFLLDPNDGPFPVQLDFLRGLDKAEVGTSTDHVDVAVSPVAAAAVKRIRPVWRAWPAEMSVERTRIDSDIIYVVTGFPRTKNRYRYGVHPVPCLLAKPEIGAHSYERYHIDPSVHLGFESVDFVTMEVGKSHKVLAPSPHGMSGGPIFRVGNFARTDTIVEPPRLVGLVVELTDDCKVIIGTKIQVALRAIQILCGEKPLPT